MFPRPTSTRRSRLPVVITALLSTICFVRTAASTELVSSELRTKAARGPVAIIVELAVPAPAGVTEIAAQQATLLTGLTGTSYRVLRRFETIPFIALEVSLDALTALAASPHVRGIQEDVRLHRHDDGPRR